MKLATFHGGQGPRLGVLTASGTELVDLTATGTTALANIQSLIDAGLHGLSTARAAQDAPAVSVPLAEVRLLAPLPCAL